MSDLTMPRLSDAMEEGTILRWLKAEGQTIEAGEELVEIETDKATVIHQAEASGVLEIMAPAGATVAVGTVIARTGSRSERPHSPAAAESDVPTPPPATEPAAPDEVSSAQPVEAAVAASADADGQSPAGASPAPASATPLARRIAHKRGLNLEQLRGSGPRGRITRSDVLAAMGETATSSPPSTWAPPRSVARSSEHDGAEFELQEPNRVQRLIARRMAEAKATIPDFDVTIDAVMDHALALRAELKQLEPEMVIPSVNDMVIKACAIALRHHPRVNASYVEGYFKLHRRVNVGVAVAAEEALIVPVIRDADAKSLGAIAEETRALAQRARTGNVAPPDLAGGTFTVSNLGMFGMTAIRPVINPPQAAILGVGVIRDVLAREAGEIIERKLMTLTLSADHRILYGADAARFLAQVKELLESPLRLVL
jgi:pyruvate dehydrogenase E2 component (dihydrolipoamide acetyltransferase)